MGVAALSSPKQKLLPESVIEAHRNSIIKRIEENSVYEPNTGCLLWTKSCHKFGYGWIRVNKKTLMLHRVVYELNNGSIPANKIVMHKCDTPSCCNINHLKLGTKKDNSIDMSSKNRWNNQYKGKEITHCIRGHEYTKKNTYISLNKGNKNCRQCSAEIHSIYRIMAKEKHIPEKAIENQILLYLYKKNIYSWKNQSVGIYDQRLGIYRKSNNPFHKKGVSDILGLLPGGRFLAIEVKARYGKVSPEQEQFINDVNKSGGLAFVARSVQDVIEKLG